MCNVCSVTSYQRLDLVRAPRDLTGNLPPMPGVFPPLSRPDCQQRVGRHARVDACALGYADASNLSQRMQLGFGCHEYRPQVARRRASRNVDTDHRRKLQALIATMPEESVTPSDPEANAARLIALLPPISLRARFRRATIAEQGAQCGRAVWVILSVLLTAEFVVRGAAVGSVRQRQ